jgi:hypothetical protein
VTCFVERAVTAVLADGTSFDMHIRVGSPRQVDEDWRCSLSVTYLFYEPRDIFGVDGWQACISPLFQRLWLNAV